MFLQSGAMRGVLATNGSNTEKEAGMHDQCTSVKSESRPVVSEQSVNGRPGPETDYGTTNLSVL